jgi:hypothetical protein
MGLTNDNRVRTFSNGTEYECWFERNCGNCTMTYEPSPDPCGCALYKALGEAFWGDGTIAREVAEQFGWAEGTLYFPACPKRDTAGGRPTGQWTPRAGDIMRRDTSGYLVCIDHVDSPDAFIRRIDKDGCCHRENITVDCLLRTAELDGVIVHRMFQWHESPVACPEREGGAG